MRGYRHFPVNAYLSLKKSSDCISHIKISEKRRIILMIITKQHALLIKKLIGKWTEGLQLEKVADKLTDEDLEYLLHLELAGLIEERDDGFGLTQAGHLIGEVIRECAGKTGNFEQWADNFKFIGSEVVTMIEVARQAQGNLEHSPEIAKQLERRGMAENGRLLPVAESVLAAYDSAFPRISLTPLLMDGLRKCPPGPGNKSVLPLSRDDIWALEAMRLLTFSLPEGNSYSLTGAGQQIRAALIQGLAPPSVLNDDIMLLMLQENPEPSARQRLQEIGAMDSSGNMLPAGKSLRNAAALLYVEPIQFIPSVSLDRVDFEVMETIVQLWDKNAENPEILPDTKTLKDHMEARGMARSTVQRSLLVLESYGLISAKRSEKDKLVYELTNLGNSILSDRQKQQLKEISARAVMAITATRAENLSPDDDWVEIAGLQGLVGKGFPTGSGRLFAHMACTVERLPVVDALQRKIIDAVPFWRGIFINHVLELLSKADRDEVLTSIDRLAGYGLLDLLPGGLCRLSEAGEAFKRAMSVVPEGIEFHVTPHILRILQAAAEHIENGKINWKKTERACGLDTEVINETVLAMRKLMYLKSDKITGAGRLLLEGQEMLANAKVHWEDVEL
ncbi:MAG: hypothetical protein DSZ23_01460 [Thermodesulfatator sp.]|nr:MAG: hypothetical protein DSZ23_01460 [Thermodesulfatator sp.]